MFRLFECCALSFFERFVLSFSLKIERFVSDSAEIWICGLYLNELLTWSEVVCCCLNKNTVLLHEAEFKALGNRKILFNTGLSPAWDESSFTRWLEEDNLCFCDTLGALGSTALLTHPHVRCMQVSTGRTRQAFDRLSEKVLANLSEYNG